MGAPRAQALGRAPAAEPGGSNVVEGPEHSAPATELAAPGDAAEGPDISAPVAEPGGSDRGRGQRHHSDSDSGSSRRDSGRWRDYSSYGYGRNIGHSYGYGAASHERLGPESGAQVHEPVHCAGVLLVGRNDEGQEA